MSQLSQEITQTIVQHALDALYQSSTVILDEKTYFHEERNVWGPDTWLLKCCWESLADAGYVDEALTVAPLSEIRQPLVMWQALEKLSKFITTKPLTDSTSLKLRLQAELRQRASVLFAQPSPTLDQTLEIQRGLFAAVTATRADDTYLALSVLERLDQIPKVWDRVFVNPELRTALSETVVRLSLAMGLHPLTNALLRNAVRRFDDAGAKFLHEITSTLAEELKEQVALNGDNANAPNPNAPNPNAPNPSNAILLMLRCIEIFRSSTLTTLHVRRLAAIAFGQAGLVGELMAQMETIENIQAARKDSGLFDWQKDSVYIRQVTRSSANTDIDFRVHTLRDAINTMPVYEVDRHERITLASQLTLMAVRSDGWTAASAVPALIRLGALKYAGDVVAKIPVSDHTRSEGHISLVRALLALNQEDAEELAEAQVERALIWLQTVPNRTAERATIWGLTDLYIEQGQPQMAMRLLALREEPEKTGLARIRKVVTDTAQGRLFRTVMNDDQLRDSGLRFRALLQLSKLGQLSADESKDLRLLFGQLRNWAPRLMDGEALIAFYVDTLLHPLLDVVALEQVWQLLPQIQTFLVSSSGDKHSVHVRRITTQLADSLLDPDTGLLNDETHQTNLIEFMVGLWQSNISQGIWQTVHSIEGSIPLLLALTGPAALVAIAQTAARDAHRLTEQFATLQLTKDDDRRWARTTQSGGAYGEPAYE
ncbi:MAG: hypothetical protein AAF639_41315 [Chloroflexota bacterium]